MTHAAPSARVRLVLSASLLKSMDGQFKHGAGYALYGNPPRWHKVHQHKPAPKGAPVVAHEPSSFQAAPASFTPEQLSQLKLPDTNVNAKTFNGQLEKLHGWASAGDAAAILGASFGVNTYGQKLAKIANHLLEQMGVTHKVAHGQKAGTHAAVQPPAPAADDGAKPEAAAPAPAEVKTTPDLQEPGPDAPLAEHVKETLDAKAADGDLEFLQNVAKNNPEHPQIAAYAQKKLVELNEAKPATASPAPAAASVVPPTGDGLDGLNLPASVKDYLLKPSVTLKNGKTVTPKEYIDDLLSDGYGNPEYFAAPKGSKAGFLTKPGKPKLTLNDKQMFYADAAFMAQKKAAKAAQPHAAATDTGHKDGDSKPAPADPTGHAKLPDGWTGFKGSLSTNKDPVNGGIVDKNATLGWFVIANNAAANAKLKDKFYPTQQAAFHALAAAVTAPATASHPMLDQIPWDEQLLPESNSNSKSHNGQVAKIKAMAYAGDIDGLQALIEKKAGAKQNYAKKQHLLAQTALAGIAEGGAPAPAAAPAASMEGKPAYDAVAIAVKKGAKPIDAAEQWLADNPGGHHELSEALIALGHPTVAADMDLPAPGMEEDAPEPAPAAAAVTADTPLHSKQLAALESLSLDELKAIDNSPGLPENVQAWIDNKIHEMESASDKGPNEGDMKPGADGMLVFKNGRWHKVKEDSAQDQQHPLDSVPLPDVSTAPGMSWKEHIGTSLSILKEKAKQDPSVLKGVAKKMANGKYIFHLPHYKPGYENSHKVKFHGFSDASKNVYDYIEALKVATGQSPKNASKKANTAPAPTASQAAPVAPVAPSGIEPMDTWVQTGGQGGSNPGGKFKDPSGQEWYCKFPDDADMAKSEVLAAKLYALAGLSGQDCKLITKDGKVGIASKWVNIKKASSHSALAKVPGALDGFAVDAWLGNWDVVGQALDNLQIGPDGKAHRVDAGGSLEYRAQGEKKPFGTNVEEIDTLRDAAKNSHAAAVFGKLKEADITASVAKVAAISDVAIRAMVNEYGPGTAAEKAKLAETLIARKQDLIKKYPKAAKAKKKPVFKPEKISAPPSFLNWGGSGKSGPSSKEFLNKANEDSVQAIFAAAKTGNLDAIKNLKAKVYDKDTGAVIGEKPVLEHPSQHVKGYAQQAVNEINYQLNPPKRFRFEGGHPLHALNSAYPSHTGGPSSATAQKLGKFIVLGEPGTLNLEDVGLPAKITHSEGGGTLSRQTYKEQAHAVWHKMPATQRQAIKSYTGSSFKKMNGSLWDGNPTGAAKAAAEALQTLGHDIQPGTVLSRHIDTSKFGPGEVEQLLKSTGKVLQEPAIMSTSIRPSSWVKSIQFKLHVGPGVKGLWVGPGSEPGGGAISVNSSEDEMLLPPNTRILILSVKPASKDADGFGAHGQQHMIEAIILPTK